MLGLRSENLISPKPDLSIVCIASKNGMISLSLKAAIFWFSILVFCILPYSHATDKIVPLPVFHAGFYINAFSDIAIEDIEVALRFWTEKLADQANYPSDTTVYESLDKMRTDFYQGKINFIVAPPLVFVNEFDLTQLTDGYKSLMHGTAFDTLIAVTHNQSGIQDFSDVKNKQLLMLEHDELMHMYLDVLTLEHFGKQSKQVFAKIRRSAKSSKMIYKLFFKKTDVILVYLQDYRLATELNPQIKHQTHIIAELASIPRGLAFFHIRTDSQLRQDAIEEAEKLHTYPKGQQLLNLFQADRMIRSSLSDLDTTRQLKQRYQQLLKQYSLP
ncbi:MAG: hypothetical protein methR_P3781 [Methyloprofundus sp.]|nr:MAG: hypothetical protein methR_P3781 [Methyloprofundus sp.]